MKKIVLTLILLILSSGLYAQLYHPGEELYYMVSYRAKLFPNTEVASVTVKTTTEQLDGRPVYKVFGYGKTLPAYRWFFPINDAYSIWIDPVSLQTQRFEADIHEGNYTFNSIYRYDWEKMEIYTSWRKRQDTKDNTMTQSLRKESMDAVSLFFHMRSARSDQFQVGEQRELQMVLEDTIRTLKYRFIGREEKKIRNYGLFRTLKFACELGTSDGFSFTDGTEFTIWISDDENKIPLYLESPIRIGSINAYIVKTKGLKYPLSSKIK
ncbi:MAG: DUF3108 domain-containing protein [Alistipes sp.]